MPQVNKKYKDTVFRHLFSEKEPLLELYNAVNGTAYTDPDGLEINTLENAIYMKFKNDISFVFGAELYLYEHQATVNPNMPLRNLFYVSTLLQGMIAKEDLYRSSRAHIPTPKFLVFYNGVQEQPETVEYRLSELFECPTKAPELELTVKVLNINEGNNETIVEASQYLHDYVRYVSMVRKNMCSMTLEKAVEAAIDTYIREGILADYLKKHKAEVEAMSIFEYNEEQHLKRVHDDALQEGLEKGIEKGRLQLLFQLMQEGILTEQDAIERAGMSRDEFLEMCEGMKGVLSE